MSKLKEIEIERILNENSFVICRGIGIRSSKTTAVLDIKKVKQQLLKNYIPISEDVKKDEILSRLDDANQSNEIPYNFYSELHDMVSSLTTISEVEEILKCGVCGGTGNLDSLEGAMECYECGGVGHRLYDREDTTLHQILEQYKTNTKEVKE